MLLTRYKVFGDGVEDFNGNLLRYDTNKSYNVTSDQLDVIVFDKSYSDTVPTR